MGVKSSIHKSIGQGKIDFKLDWLHPLGRGLSSADCLANEASSNPLSALVGSIFLRQNNIFRGDERLDILLEKAINDSCYRVNFRRPIFDGDRQQQSITFQNTLTPATSVHGIATDSFGSVHGGVRLRRLAIEIDQKWASDSKLTRMVGMRIEQVGSIDDNGHPIRTDSYECPTTFSGNTYDRMLVAKVGTEYLESNDSFFSQFNVLLEQGLPISPHWLRFKRFKVLRRKGVQLGPTFVFSRLDCYRVSYLQILEQTWVLEEESLGILLVHVENQDMVLGLV
ncbi:outer envelope protein 39, chloroplastic isoform X2 [Cryptomeria japonica]|uniref:outer envelope protein 39, chloroplastic isoform X2 n=1 Tax=Cryptomeria japonica TaxID=3369 RepID=UPI0027DAA76D|nr:outer envelope protein 39, chloroplastic isoform X2 [Cryptomeria japonica]